MTHLRRHLLVLAVLSVPSYAQAQAGGAPAPVAEPKEDAEPEVDEETSVNDDPNTADAVTTREDAEPAAVAKKKKVRPTKATFPVELVDRPMTLTRNTAQISVDIPIANLPLEDGSFATQVIKGAFGVTQDIQVGVSYGVGIERISKPEGAKGFESGKAFSVDAAYTVLPDHIAVAVSFPFYADPFAASMTLGVPLKVKLGDRLALVGGQDLVEVAFNKWAVRVAEPAHNLEQIAEDEMNIPYSSGAVNLNFGPIVQVKKNVAVFGTFNVRFEDFSSEDQPISLFAGATWSKWNIDLSGRLGWSELDKGDTFGLGLFAAYRL